MRQQARDGEVGRGAGVDAALLQLGIEGEEVGGEGAGIGRGGETGGERRRQRPHPIGDDGTVLAVARAESAGAEPLPPRGTRVRLAWQAGDTVALEAE